MKNRKLNRRDFLRLSAAVATGAVAAACAPGTPQVIEVEKEVPVREVVVQTVEVEKEVPAAVKPAEMITIDWQVYAPEEGELEAQLVAWGEAFPKWQEAHPNIAIKFSPAPSEQFQKLMAAFTAGNAPDIYGLCCSNTWQVIEKRQALNLQPYIDRDLGELNMDDYYPGTFDPWTNDEGNICAMPRYSGCQLLFYNQDMFQEKNVDFLPRSFEDNIDHSDYDEIGLQFVQRADPIMWSTTTYGVGANWLTQYHLWAWGATMVDPNSRDHCTLGEGPAQEALEWMRAAIWDKHTFAYGAEMGGLGPTGVFIGERSAMIEMGPWNLLPFCETRFKWDVAPLPDGPAAHTGFNSVDAHQVWSGTSIPDACWEFLKFLVSPTWVKPYCRYTLQSPSQSSIQDTWIESIREEQARLEEVNLELYKEARLLGHPEEMFHNDATCKQQILKAGFDKVMLLGEQPVSYIIPFCELVDKFNLGEIGIEELGGAMQDIESKAG